MAVRTAVTAMAIAAAIAGGAIVAQHGPLKSGLDPAGFDKTVHPQDDLFRYVSGGWLAKTELPPDSRILGALVEVSDRVEGDLHALIQELAGNPNKRSGSTAQQVGDFYAAYRNETRVNALGAEPLKPRLAPADQGNWRRQFTAASRQRPAGRGYLRNPCRWT